MRKKTKLVFGVGINDADYSVCITAIVDGKRKTIWVCPFYQKWISILERCYYPNAQKRRPTYQGCSIISEWCTFSNFKSWMEKQDWQDKHLDKDLLVPGNKIYGPDACIFVSQAVNSFVTESKASRGEYPIGVCFDKSKGKFVAQCWDVIIGKQKRLGQFTDPQEAHQAWLSYKLEQAKILAAKQTDPRVAAALIARYENYEEIFGSGA